MVGAIGLVFGDVGTSPLYTMSEAFSGIPPRPFNALGVRSLVLATHPA